MTKMRCTRSFLSVKDDPFPAPADPEENLIDEFGAGMREGDAAIGHR